MNRLKAALDPRSVAIIGASENPNKVGGRPVHYLDKFGFKGRIFPINPSRAEVQGHKCYKSLDDLHLGARRIDRENPALEAELVEVMHRAAADLVGILRCADDGDGTRI